MNATTQIAPSITVPSGKPAMRQAVPRWQLVLLIAVLAALYGSVLVGLGVQAYKDPDYSHAFFVPFFVAYLIWRKRRELAELPAEASASGLVIVLGAQLLLFLGSLGAELFLARISFLLTLVGLVLYFRGWRTLKALAFPLAFLLFMIPLPALIYNEIVFPLQLVASRFATTCLESVRVVPVLREGNLLILPNYTLEVVEACSGIRSLMSLMALSIGYGYLVERSWILRVILAAIMLPLAIFSNGLRVMGAALATHYWGPDTAEGFLHTFSGLAIFLLATVLLVALHKLFSFLRGRIRNKKVPA